MNFLITCTRLFFIFFYFFINTVYSYMCFGEYVYVCVIYVYIYRWISSILWKWFPLDIRNINFLYTHIQRLFQMSYLECQEVWQQWSVIWQKIQISWIFSPTLNSSLVELMSVSIMQGFHTTIASSVSPFLLVHYLCILLNTSENVQKCAGFNYMFLCDFIHSHLLHI